MATGLGFFWTFILLNRELHGPIDYAGLVVVGILFIWAAWVAHKEGSGTTSLAQIDTWYKHLKNDTGSVFNLVLLYDAGKNKDFFTKHPKQAQKVFEAALYWLELIETGQIDEIENPELEDYYWLGLMYEEGFATPANLKQAAEYYQKALTTTSCWDGSSQEYKKLRHQVEQRLANLTQPQ